MSLQTFVVVKNPRNEIVVVSMSTMGGNLDFIGSKRIN